ncbi:MAG: acyloxyacyl hydrolase [Flavobacteriales bacterium]|nr:acyloxyacyl hydrolase [Flavobacteriales bacterium]
MRTIKSSFLITLICLSLSGLAQSDFFNNTAVNVGFHQGALLPEYQFINYLSQDYTRSFDLSFVKETTGNNSWEQIYNYPSFGFSFFYSTLGNDDVFGQEYAFTPFFRINLLNRPKFKIYNQTGLGFGYVTKKFDLVDNYQNVAVGSHGNFHFNVRIGTKIQLFQNASLLAGVSLDHFSNANTSEPNLGLNYLSYFFGLEIPLGKKDELLKNELPPKEKVIQNELIYSFGGKHSRSLSSKYYFTSSLSFEKRKSFFRALHLGIGADLFYDTSIKNQLEGNSETFKSYYKFQTGLHISQSIIYDKFSFTLQEGIYLGLTERVEKYVMYNRGIIKYWVTDQFSVRLSMKSHLHILDYPEIGIGIKL